MAPDSYPRAAGPVPSVELGTPSSGRDLAARSRLLLEATETIYLSLDSSSLETTILAEAARASGAQKAALRLERRRVRRPGGPGDERPVPGLFVVPMEGSVFGRAVLDGDTVVVEDMERGRSTARPGEATAAPSWPRRFRVTAPPTAPSPCSTPLPRRFDDEEQNMVRTFAIQAAIALDNRRLMQEKDRMAVRDGLTGVYNRSYLELAMERSAKDLRRNGGVVSVLFPRCRRHERRQRQLRPSGR